jgi:hypothetical protein
VSPRTLLPRRLLAVDSEALRFVEGQVADHSNRRWLRHTHVAESGDSHDHGLNVRSDPGASVRHVGACVASQIAAHDDARDAGQAGCQRLMDEPRQIFESGRTKPGDIVEHSVVKQIVDPRQFRAEMAEVKQHARSRIRVATNHDGRAIAVAVDPAAGFGLNRALEGVRGLENKGLRQFVHGRIVAAAPVCSPGRAGMLRV